VKSLTRDLGLREGKRGKSEENVCEGSRLKERSRIRQKIEYVECAPHLKEEKKERRTIFEIDQRNYPKRKRGKKQKGRYCQKEGK